MAIRDPEKRREYARKYREANREKELERKRKYREAIQERKIRAYLEYRAYRNFLKLAQEIKGAATA